MRFAVLLFIASFIVIKCIMPAHKESDKTMFEQCLDAGISAAHCKADYTNMYGSK